MTPEKPRQPSVKQSDHSRSSHPHAHPHPQSPTSPSAQKPTVPRADLLRQATFTTAVQLLAWGFIALCYTTYTVILKTYLRPLFWAAILSIPFHRLKTKMTTTLHLAPKEIVMTIMKTLLGNTICRFMFGTAQRRYSTAVRYVSGATLIANNTERTQQAELPSIRRSLSQSLASYMTGNAHTGHPMRSRSLADVAPLRPLAILLRCCVLYGLCNISWKTYHTIMVVVGIIVALHIVGTALHAVLGIHLQWNLAAAYKRCGGDYCTHWCRSYIRRHTNGFVTVAIMITMIVATGLFSLLCIFKIVDESNQLVSAIVTSVNQNVHGNGTIAQSAAALYYKVTQEPLDGALVWTRITTQYPLFSRLESISSASKSRNVTASVLDHIFTRVAEGNYTAVAELAKEVSKGSPELWSRMSEYGLTALSFVSVFVFDGVTFAWDFVIKASLFLMLLLQLMMAEHNILHYASDLLFLDEREIVRSSIEDTINGIITTSCLQATFQSLFTWLVYKVLDVEFVYLAALSSGILTIIPVNKFRTIRGIGLSSTRFYIHGIALFMLHWAASFVTSGTIYSSGLMVYAQIGALYAVGIEGLLLGPLLLCIVQIAFRIFQDYQRDALL